MSKSYAIIDSLIGYHLDGAPRGDFATAINLINESGKRVVSYDLPSGVDATTGECYSPCVKANVTLTLALPKRVFKNKKAKQYFGRVYLADIGIPEFLYKKVNPKIKRPFLIGNGLVEL